MVEKALRLETNSETTTIDRMTINRFISNFYNSRNFDEIFGYNPCPSSHDYLDTYRRQNIAERIIDAYPSATWSNPPTISDSIDTKEASNFDKEVSKVFRKHRIYQILHRADKLTQLGRFGLLVFGVMDGQTLETPLNPKGKFDLAYIKPFGEKDVEIYKCETSVQSPRFGLPTQYKITVETPSAIGTGSIQTQQVIVDHSRCIHLAENTLDNPIYGKPRLESIMDNLFDLKKVVGGSAEMFWLNGRGGLVAAADKDTEISNPEALKKNFDDYSDNLTRVIRVKGMSVTPLNITVPDPKSQFEVIISLISGATGIPQRVLLGSERGQLASSQDKGNWQDRINERRVNYSEPDVLCKVVDKLMEIGMIPKVEDYFIQWDKLGEPDEKSIAETAQKMSTALASYVNSPQANQVITERQFVEDILQMTYLVKDIEEDEGFIDENDVIEEENTMFGGGNETKEGLPNHAEPFEN